MLGETNRWEHAEEVDGSSDAAGNAESTHGVFPGEEISASDGEAAQNVTAHSLAATGVDVDEADERPQSPLLESAEVVEPKAAAAAGPETFEATAAAIELAETVQKLVDAQEKHHQRAAHRESVIDSMHVELERLRLGERRGIVRPLLVALTRFRDDLVRQASGLPGDFDADRAANLLRSFADSVEITLDDFGVAPLVPSVGDVFEPRRHTAVGSEPTVDPDRVRTIVSVRKEGYLDVESDLVLAHAEVMVYVEADRQDVQSAEPSSATVGRSPEPSAHPSQSTTHYLENSP